MKPSPPTADEYYAMVRSHERQHAIPQRLVTIEKWLSTIASNDVRRMPDIQKSKDGKTFISRVTDLGRIFDHVQTVRRWCRAGEFELALSSLRSLESRIRAVNNRIIEPDIQLARRVRRNTPEGIAKAELQRKTTRDRYRLYVDDFNAARLAGLSKGEAEERAARRNTVSVRTVRNAVKEISET